MITLEVGMKAPELIGCDADGRQVSLKDLNGRKLVLFFYPKDDTPGCTKEACSLRDGHKELRDAGYEVIGVSPDTVGKHRKFSDKYGLGFRLLSDPDLVNAKAYGVWGPKKFMGREYMGIQRTTFLIDEQGYVEHVLRKVRTRDHALQVLAILNKDQGEPNIHT